MDERTRTPGTSFTSSSFSSDEDEVDSSVDETTGTGDHHFDTSFNPDLYMGNQGIETFLNNNEDKHIQILVQRESRAGFGISKSFVKTPSWLESARLEAIVWIFEARESFGFLYDTAYISVTYFDRFLSMLPIIDDGEIWAIRSLATACLSLAAKIEENKKRPGLSKLSGYSFVWEAIWRNELIVLEAFEWKMAPITPFHYLNYFINIFCGEAKPEGLVYRVVQLIMAATKEINLMDHRPSVIAASAVLRAFDDQLTKEQFELKMNDVISLWGSIEKEHIFSSYYMMENVEMGKVKTIRPTADFLNLSSTHSSLIGVVQSSSHTVAVRIKRKLGFANFGSQDQKRSRES
ncbi:cyclin-D5-1-like [Corylus avellana]|uniref:cyclin-D5-1-like n=1 Tax=Corylus avellana TaxID=13451 RepID=UPI00286B70A5|nr:cyclin-D5-1-like [Corylus avellana]